MQNIIISTVCVAHLNCYVHTGVYENSGVGCMDQQHINNTPLAIFFNINTDERYHQGGSKLESCWSNSSSTKNRFIMYTLFCEYIFMSVWEVFCMLRSDQHWEGEETTSVEQASVWLTAVSSHLHHLGIFVTHK